KKAKKLYFFCLQIKNLTISLETAIMIYSSDLKMKDSELHQGVQFKENS
ncbi:hypothetical protein SAMN04488244_1141, partial [Vibrio hangzhouensis]